MKTILDVTTKFQIEHHFVPSFTSFKVKHQAGKIKEILNLNPSCPSRVKDKAVETVCMYVKKTILDN